MARHPILLKRFEQECAAVTRLRHPHIVGGVDFGVADGRPYLVMEYIDGQSLDERVARQGPLSEAEAVLLGTEIGAALEAAHKANLIHRDIKPENILLTKEGRGKLTDLGLVKDLEGEELLTRSGAWLGTISYMAPEQFGEARNVDARCDVYGLAATLYFALTGVNPFPQKGGLTVLGNKLKNRFPPPRRVVPSLSESISAAICRGLDANLRHRPATCAAFVELLKDATPAPAKGAPEQEPRQADPDDPERRRARRFPTAVAAVCAAVRGGKQHWPVKVQDVSLTGVRMQLGRRFEPSAVLEVQVSGMAEQEGTFLVRVCWVRQTAPALWNHGCAFGRAMIESDLDVFLKGSPTTVVRRPDE
jgi:eukaryotic-like serine/threonine-protein kinase